MRTAKLPIPLTLPYVFKSALPKTAVDDAPGSSLLGLTTTVGAPLLGNAANNNQKTDVAGWMARIPENYAEGRTVILRIRAKCATSLPSGGSRYAKVDATATLMGDAAVGSDLVTTSPTQVTIAYADYDFVITSASLRRGSILWGTVTCDNQDTGGANNKAMSIAALTLLVPVAS